MPTRRAKLFPTPEDAETAFYEAFERADLPAMMAVWAERDDVVCVHPRGPRLVGFDAVRESWARIFSGGAANLRVRVGDVLKLDGNSVSVHALVEVLSNSAQPNAPSQSVTATNVYELTDRGWRMVIHQASPVPEPEPAVDDTPSPPSHTLH
jgi:uncharacterized protein (TIGR02246 family)